MSLMPSLVELFLERVVRCEQSPSPPVTFSEDPARDRGGRWELLRPGLPFGVVEEGTVMSAESVAMLRYAGAMGAHVRAAPTDQPQLLRDERS